MVLFLSFRISISVIWTQLFVLIDYASALSAIPKVFTQNLRTNQPLSKPLRLFHFVGDNNDNATIIIINQYLVVIFSIFKLYRVWKVLVYVWVKVNSRSLLQSAISFGNR